MHTNIYGFFQILNTLCIFSRSDFWSDFFPVQVFEINRFDDRSGSDNIDIKYLIIVVPSNGGETLASIWRIGLLLKLLSYKYDNIKRFR
jgi:hypothetical protein